MKNCFSHRQYRGTANAGFRDRRRSIPSQLRTLRSGGAGQRKNRGRYAIIAKTVLSVKKANIGVFEKIAESGFLQHVYLHSTGNDSGIITHVGIHNDGNFIRSSFPKSEKF